MGFAPPLAPIERREHAINKVSKVLAILVVANTLYYIIMYLVVVLYENVKCLIFPIDQDYKKKRFKKINIITNLLGIEVCLYIYFFIFFSKN